MAIDAPLKKSFLLWLTVLNVDNMKRNDIAKIVELFPLDSEH